MVFLISSNSSSSFYLILLNVRELLNLVRWKRRRLIVGINTIRVYTLFLPLLLNFRLPKYLEVDRTIPKVIKAVGIGVFELVRAVVRPGINLSRAYYSTKFRGINRLAINNRSISLAGLINFPNLIGLQLNSYFIGRSPI